MVFAASNTGLPLSTDTTSQGVSFNFSYAPGTRQEVIDGFERAGRLWSSQLVDTYFDKDSFSNRQTQINIYVNFAGLANDAALGGARPGMVRVSYNKFLTATFQDMSSADDWSAFRNLQLNGADKAIEGILKTLGVNKDNADSQNRQILTNWELSVRPDLSIQAQSQALFDQLTPKQLARLNRDALKFDSDQFSMTVSSTNQVKFSFKESQGQATIDGAVIDNNGNDNNKKIWLTRANAKALNLLDGADETFDGEITLSDAMLGSGSEIVSLSRWLSNRVGSSWNANQSIWDFSRVYSDTASVAANKFDFLSVAQHEIGHILGFTSGTDAFKMLTSLAAESGTTTLEEKDIAYTAPMDLFRYSDTSQQQGVFDWSIGAGEKYFSIDGGRTRLANFATGAGNDDFQGSHWSNQPITPVGIMNPALNRGQILQISNLDLQLLDVIGWDRATPKVLDNQKGLNIGIGAVGNQLSDKVRATGLDWSRLESLFTKPTEQLLTQLEAERAAIAPFQQAKLQTDLQTQQAQLATEQVALKARQDSVSGQLSTVEKTLSTQMSILSNLQKSVTDLQKPLQDVESKILSQQTALRTATGSKRTSIEAEIAKLVNQRSLLLNQLQAQQTQLSNQQSVVGNTQTQINNLRTQLTSLQTTPLIEALRAKIAELQNTLKVLDLLKDEAAQAAGSATVGKFDALKSTSESRLSGLTWAENGSRRIQEEQRILDQVIAVAQEQEKFWSQLVAKYKSVLLPGVTMQVTSWLSETPEHLKVRMETATTLQLATLLQLANQPSSSQAQSWATKVQQATMLLAQVDAKTAERLWRQAAKELPKLLENAGPDNPLTRASSNSSGTIFRFWQTANPMFLAESAYSTVGTSVEGVENADLMMQFALTRTQSSSGGTTFRFWQTANPMFLAESAYSTVGTSVESAENTSLDVRSHSESSGSQNPLKVLSAPSSVASNPLQTGFESAQQQNAVEQVVKLALKWEHFWNQPVANHEPQIFPEVQSQTASWLSGTPESLKVPITISGQLALLLQPLNQNTTNLGQSWTVEVQQVKTLPQFDAQTTEKVERRAAKQLAEWLEDPDLDRSYLVL